MFWGSDSNYWMIVTTVFQNNDKYVFDIQSNALRDLVSFLYNLKNVKNIHGEVLLLVKMQAKKKPATISKKSLQLY